jgi:hypothetical protein
LFAGLAFASLASDSCPCPSCRLCLPWRVVSLLVRDPQRKSCPPTRSFPDASYCEGYPACDRHASA